MTSSKMRVQRNGNAILTWNCTKILKSWKWFSQKLSDDKNCASWSSQYVFWWPRGNTVNPIRSCDNMDMCFLYPYVLKTVLFWLVLIFISRQNCPELIGIMSDYNFTWSKILFAGVLSPRDLFYSILSYSVNCTHCAEVGCVHSWSSRQLWIREYSVNCAKPLRKIILWQTWAKFSNTKLRDTNLGTKQGDFIEYISIFLQLKQEASE